jgi:hypothetical protein
MAYDYLPDHPERTQRQVSSQFLSSEALMAILGGIGEGFQMSEDDIFDVSTSSGLTTAYGAGLDAWGDLVGEPRGPLNDTQYRRFIAAAGIANVSSGVHDQIVACALAMGASNCYTFTLPGQADVTIELILVDSWSDDVLRRARAILETCRAAAIGPAAPGGMVWSPPDAFRLDVGPGLDVGVLAVSF